MDIKPLNGDFRQEMMRKTCHIFSSTISSCIDTGNIKLFNDSNAYEHVFPKIMKLLNKGLLIDGIKTYTIDSNWGKKNSEYVTLSKDKLLLVINGMFRQYLNFIKKNMSPNDISSLIFSYFEDDDNRYCTSYQEVQLFGIFQMQHNVQTANAIFD